MGGVDEEEVAGVEGGEAVERELHGVDGLWIDGDEIGVQCGRARDVGDQPEPSSRMRSGGSWRRRARSSSASPGPVEGVVEAERRGGRRRRRRAR